VFSDYKTMHVIQDKSVFESPHDTAVMLGVDAIYKVKAVGTSITYQWQVDDGGGYQSISSNHPNYIGVNTDKLTVKTTTFSLTGNKYRCLIYGGCRTEPIASNDAHLGLWWPTSVGIVGNTISDVMVFPNPASGSELTIVMKDATGSVNARIVDNLGRTVATEHLAMNNSTSKLNISALPAGVYRIVLSDIQFNTVKAVMFTKQ
jgi:hypothetical protein